jgi:hypothetical protein
LAIQPSPAHAAVARPMMPTEVLDAMAESIRPISCWPRSPDTAPLMFASMLASSSGLLARTNPPAANPTISKGNSAKIVK